MWVTFQEIMQMTIFVFHSIKVWKINAHWQAYFYWILITALVFQYWLNLEYDDLFHWQREKKKNCNFCCSLLGFFLFWKLFDYTACLNYIDHWHYVLPPLFFFLLVVLVPLLKSIFCYSLNRQGIAHLTDDFVEQQCDSPVLNVDMEYGYCTVGSLLRLILLSLVFEKSVANVV